MSPPSRTVLLGLFLLSSACGQSALDPGPSGLGVQATLSAVTLADDCPSAADADRAGAAAPCESPDNCRSLCQQSNLQIDLSSDDGSDKSVRFEIVAVRVRESASRTEVAQPVAREAQRWSSNGYIAWDEQIPPSATLKLSYKLSALAWTTSTSFEASLRAESYLVEVDVRIDGVVRTLSLDGVTREPIVAT